MTAADAVAEYGRALTQEVFDEAGVTGEQQRDVFINRVLTLLEEGGFVNNPYAQYLESRAAGVVLHGFGYTEDGAVLELYGSAFSYDRPNMNKTELEKAYRQMLAILPKLGKLMGANDPLSDVYRLCEAIKRKFKSPDLRTIRVIFMTTRPYAARSTLVPGDMDGIPVEYDLFDLKRLYRLETAGGVGEEIEIDFDPPLPCLPAQANDDDHSVLLAVIPGRRLAELYDEHRTRLLQLNVRAFLQTRGAVNKGIRTSALERPDWFLAYNNGVTTTAGKAEFVKDENGRVTAIKHLTGLQIVNGGQTTATLHHVLTKDKDPLTGVDVQMKLTLVPDETRLGEVVSKISEYSNTQNRVSKVDFSSNDRFHVEYEKVSRTLWTPTDQATGLQTRWFYVRTRGAYEVELGRNTTTATRRKFRAENPPGQKYDKTDLAKVVNCWEGKPYLVAKGAQKNFADFQQHVTDHPPLIDTTYVRRTIALKLLFAAVDSAARDAESGSNKSAVTAYTMAMLVHAAEQRIDLDRVWREQTQYEAKAPKMTPVLMDAIRDLVVQVKAVIIKPGVHPIEWAKNPDCWVAVQAIDWQVPNSLEAELLDAPLRLERDEAAAREDLRQRFDEVEADDWQALYEWAGETTGLLELNEQAVVGAVASRLAEGEAVPENRMGQALDILEKAVAAEFDPDPDY